MRDPPFVRRPNVPRKISLVTRLMGIFSARAGRPGVGKKGADVRHEGRAHKLARGRARLAA